MMAARAAGRRSFMVVMETIQLAAGENAFSSVLVDVPVPARANARGVEYDRSAGAKTRFGGCAS